MDRKRRTLWRRVFLVAFAVLTSLVWCPWAYGTIEGRTLGIPTWAVLAIGFAAALFVLELVFLFFTGLAVNDEELAGILSDLEAAGADTPAEPKEGE